ncbi:MAG: hypothetical protein BWX71_02312 [Deltaproteobacteria bacterium ADurb.Bin072]|nr:MAG: hypothetical protein BWX71_02312 [Deltaproteobacteria bacterium ADurb.Bin072]
MDENPTCSSGISDGLNSFTPAISSENFWGAKDSTEQAKARSRVR